MSEIKYTQKNDSRPITLAELQNFAKGILIDIPSFIDGEFIKVKVKRIDMTKSFLNKPQITNFLANPVIDKYMKDDKLKTLSQDEIKNKLIQESSTLSNEDLKSIQELLPLLDEIAKEILIEPTYEDFSSACGGLSQKQKEFLFNWAIAETTSLQSFRNGG